MCYSYAYLYINFHKFAPLLSQCREMMSFILCTETQMIEEILFNFLANTSFEKRCEMFADSLDLC